MKPSTASFYEQAVSAALRDVVAALDSALDLDELAGRASTSPFHFHRIFRGMTGETPPAMSRRLRMERAAWQLASTDTRVTDVAFAAGFETHESFSRAFRDAYSVSPSGFRRRTHPRIELAAPCGLHFHPGGIAAGDATLVTIGGTMDVEIVQSPELRLAAVRHVGPYNQVPVAFEALGRRIAELSVELPPTMLAVYHDDVETTPQDELRADAAIAVAAGTEIPDGLDEVVLPASRCARTTHTGPYERLGDTWNRLLGQWLPASGERLRDTPCYEVYRNTPADAAPADLVTVLYLPIE